MFIKARTGLLATVLMLAVTFPASAGDVEKGKILFKKHCKSCHRLTEGVLLGPSLKGVTKRLSEEWLDKWLEDPKAVFESGDPYAVEIVGKYKKMMPKKAGMGKKENRDDVIMFLKANENSD